jgi:hypothetical protein
MVKERMELPYFIVVYPLTPHCTSTLSKTGSWMTEYERFRLVMPTVGFPQRVLWRHAARIFCICIAFKFVFVFNFAIS